MSILLPYAPGEFATHPSVAAYPFLWDGLVANYDPDAYGPTGLVLPDTSLVQNPDGVLTNMDPATAWVMTEKGWALDFVAGSSQYIKCPKTTATSAGGDFSVFAWINQDGDFNRTIFSEDRADQTTYYRHRFQVNLGNLTYDNFSPSGGGLTFATGLAANTWYQVGFIRTGTTIRVYVNGTSPVASQAGDTSNRADIAITSIGASRAGAFFDGMMCNVAAWTRALTPSEIQLLYDVPHAITMLRPRAYPLGAAVPGGLSIPIAMRHYMQMQGVA